MLKSIVIAASALALTTGAIAAGPHKAAPTTTIVDAAVATDDLSTLVAAVKVAGLVDTLNSKGPFTVFAPRNAAFADIQGTVDTLLQPANKQALQGVLTYHVVAGNVTAADLVHKIKDAGGPITVETVAGGTLAIALQGNKVTILDSQGGLSTVTIADLQQSNGIVHVIDRVLLPSS